MHHLLIIGRPGDDWARRLRQLTAAHVDIDAERLPSAGIRTFQQNPADLIVITDTRGGERVEILANAIRQRPLGQLVPLLLVCPLPEGDATSDKIAALDLVDWLPPDITSTSLVEIIEDALDVDLRAKDAPLADVDSRTEGDPSPPAHRPQKAGDGSASYFGGDVVLEPVDEPPSQRRIKRRDLFRSPTSRIDPSDDRVSAEDIERKLKAVRHDDYYTILELRRGAESQPVREAFHRLYDRFDPDALDFQLLRQYQDEVAEIRDALQDAFAVLGDPELRRAYREHTLR